MDPTNETPAIHAAPPAPSDKGRRALGRGLAALLPPAGAPAPAAVERKGPIFLPIEEIEPERLQPRKHFNMAILEELAASIRAHGILQPILVRKSATGYALICGERRWRAAQIAGLREVPAVIREATDDQAFEMALIENIQREDLSPIEEAEAYRRLMDEHGLTQDDMGRRVGKDRTTIANALRLLRLPEEVKNLITRGELSMGHARALLGITDEVVLKKAAQEVVRTRVSVRATERIVQRLRAPAGSSKSSAAAPSPGVVALVENLQRALGARVRIEEKGGKGTLAIEFASLEQLDGILARVLRT